MTQLAPDPARGELGSVRLPDASQREARDVLVDAHLLGLPVGRVERPARVVVLGEDVVVLGPGGGGERKSISCRTWSANDSITALRTGIPWRRSPATARLTSPVSK